MVCQSYENGIRLLGINYGELIWQITSLMYNENKLIFSDCSFTIKAAERRQLKLKTQLGAWQNNPRPSV